MKLASTLEPKTIEEVLCNLETPYVANESDDDPLKDWNVRVIRGYSGKSYQDYKEKVQRRVDVNKVNRKCSHLGARISQGCCQICLDYSPKCVTQCFSDLDIASCDIGRGIETVQFSKQLGNKEQCER